MVKQYHVQLVAHRRGFHLITDFVAKAVEAWPTEGLLHVFIQHTSAGLTINENADPSVRQDFERVFRRLVPEGPADYVHRYEGPDDMPAHIKASLVGSAVSIPITQGRLALGTWQGIYLCEFRDHGGPRQLVVTVYS